MSLRSLEWATEPGEAEEYVNVEAGILEAVSRVGLEVEGHYASNGQSGVVFGVECYFEVDSFVAEHEALTYVIDKAHWSFLDPKNDLFVGLLKNQVQRWRSLVS